MKTAPQRQFRVFVSSTFKDMMEERNVLLEKVFPRVAEYCHARKTEFIGVDLRWGITEEQSRKGETIGICMAEIDRARPLFMGMIGERYGWVPPEADISVTEQEIRYGALEAPKGTEAFFYLRDKELTEALCGQSAPDPRLDTLRQRILASGYPVMTDYQDLDSFAQRVYEDLCGAVDRLTADLPELSPAEEVRQDQLFLARRYASGYVDRPAERTALDALARMGGLILLTGDNGTGKTVFLSQWALEQETDPDLWTFVSFIGSAADLGWERLARQMLAELRERFGPDIPEGQDAESLRRALWLALNMAARRSRVLLVLDNLDALALEDSYGLSWLPEELPEGVTVVVSLNEGEAMNRLRRRAHREIRLKLLTPDAVRDIARQSLAAYGKSLSVEQMALLENSAAARNPLYLSVLLSELRFSGRFERLTEQLRDYLDCPDLPALFDKVLSRLDQDYGEGISLPRSFFLLLEASGSGLSETELLGLLDGLPYARFAPLRLAAEPFTAVVEGALRISSRIFREAILVHYAPEEAELAALRDRVAGWFMRGTDTPRRVRVLPRLLTESGQYGRLYDLLSEPDSFRELWRRNRYETRALWAQLGEHGFSPREGYQEVLAHPTTEDMLSVDMAAFFLDRGETDSAKTLLRAVTEVKGGGNLRQRGAALGLLGNLLQREGAWTDAAECYRRKEELARQIGDRYEQERALGNLGLLALARGEPEAAREAFEGVLALARSLNQRDAEQVALGNLGNIAFSRGDLSRARALYERQKDICLDSGNAAGTVNACGALGLLGLREKDYNAAEREFALQEAESRRLGMPDGLANALGNRALLALQQGRRDEAENLFWQKLALCRETGQALGEQNALRNLSVLAAGRGEAETALALARERAELTRRCRAFRQYYDALHQLSSLEEAGGQTAEAARHRLEAEALGRQHGFTQS